MNLRILTVAILLSMLSASTPTAVLSQPSPDNRYQPGFWQPEGKVNPNNEIKVKFLNETGFTLEYGKSEGYPSLLPPKETREIIVRIGSGKGDISTIPINTASGMVPLRFEYNVVNNLVTVRIVQTSGGDARQGLAVYIDETGRVYTF
ncbi:hypothetical protein BCD67_23160 [Oscillatoriales cyanobacterium USR001]|nr:hypothetical protein BCD67_23160 [Oscillatoriales cyanobacterium USR001]